MSSHALAQRYSKALFGLAEEKKSAENISEDLSMVVAVAGESPVFRSVLSNPLVSRKEKAEVLAAVATKGKASELTVRFLKTLALNGRSTILKEVAKAYNDILLEKKGEAVAKVISAAELNKARIGQIEKDLGKVFGKKIKAETKKDENILGGLVVTVGSLRLDASVAGKLERLKEVSRKALAEAA